MKRALWKIVQEASELPASERDTFLDEQCGGDTAMRERIQRGIAQLEASGLADGPSLSAFLEEIAASSESARASENGRTNERRYESRRTGRSKQ